MGSIDDRGDRGIEAFGYKQELKRTLSLFDLIVYGLVFMVPIAPFTVFGFVYNTGGGMVPLVYLVGLAAMLFTALSYMSMSRAFPVAGSVYSYAAKSLGPTIGYAAGWAILLDYLLLPAVAYVACAIAMYSVMPAIPKMAWAIALPIVATLVNHFGMVITARVSVFLLALQLLILFIFIAAGVIALAHPPAGAHVSLLPFFNPAVLTPQLIFGALSLAVLSFLGFDAISTLSEEATGGSKAIAQATMWSLCIAALLFVAQTYVASLFVLGHLNFAAGDETEAAFYNIGSMIGRAIGGPMQGEWLKYLLTVPGILLATIAGALTAQAATARLLFGMARDGKLPRALAYVHPTRKVPDRAIYLIGVVSIAIATTLVEQLELLASMVSFGALVGFAMLHISVVVHFIVREKSRNWARHLVVPVIGFAVTAYVLINAQADAMIAGAVWMAAGLVLFVVLKMTGRPTDLPIENETVR